MWPQLLDMFPDQNPIERSSMNSWDSQEFKTAIENTGKKNITVSGLWTEVCVAWPTLSMINAGYNVFVVADACGGTSEITHGSAMQKLFRLGLFPVQHFKRS